MSEQNPLPQSSDDPGPAPRKRAAASSAGETTREDRLKAALKANMARRKAQAKARAATADHKNKE